MARLLKDETLIATWKGFFENYCKPDIETLALSYPKTRSLCVDYDIIDKDNTELSEGLINHPYKFIFNAEQALKEIDTSVGYIQLHFRIKNLPEIQHVSIRNIRSEHMGKFVSVDGLVKKDTTIKATVKNGAFQCQKCGCIIKVEQEEDILKDPSECYENQGGCGRVSTFKLLLIKSIFIDGQKIQLQENPEKLRGAEQPQKITVYLEDDIVGKIYPGDRVRINGILHSVVRRKGNATLVSFDFAIDAVSIEINESAYEEIDITEEDKEDILNISKDPDIYNKMRQSIAPTIYGMETEKDALVLQLFGGVSKSPADGTKIRGDIHILLVGDPGTGKSQLLKYQQQSAPRAILASGSASTKAGLTATAIKDEFSEGQWTLEAGALVLANDGLACIDEFDKMREEDRGSMHQAMEQQEISIAKAGINATLKSKCCVLGVANPKQGRFDSFKPLHEQINMKPALLSRFDLIFPITDKPHRKKDMELSAHILRTHRGSEITENRLKTDDSEYSKEEEDAYSENIIPIFSPEFLRKYVAYAKRNIFPVMTEEATNVIQNYYVDFRGKSEESVPFTPRQLEGFIRLAEASARVRLSNKVTVDDAKNSISIVDNYLRRVAVDPETGKIDIDKIAIGVSHSQQDRMKKIVGIISVLCESSSGGASVEDIVREAEIEGIGKDKTEDALEHLKRNDQLFEPTQGRFKIYA